MCRQTPFLHHINNEGGARGLRPAHTTTQPGPGDGTNNSANAAARACIGSNPPLSHSHKESSSQFPFPIRSQSPIHGHDHGQSPLTLVTRSPMQHITHPPMSRLDPRAAAGAKGQGRCTEGRSGADNRHTRATCLRDMTTQSGGRTDRARGLLTVFGECSVVSSSGTDVGGGHHHTHLTTHSPQDPRAAPARSN